MHHFVRGAAASLTLAIAAGGSASAGPIVSRGAIRPIVFPRASNARFAGPLTANPNQVVAEGGQGAALVLGNILDVVGTPIVVSTNPTVYRDGALPTPAELGIPASPLSRYQYDYAAVGAAASQLDFIDQQSGFDAASTANFPATNDGEESYSNAAPFGFVPWSEKKAEPLSPTTASDSIHWAEGDSPLPLGPVNPQFGTGTYKDSLASYNGTISNPGSPEGFNANRGPAVVVPILATGISIVYNKTGLTIPAGGLRLTQNDVCGIFTGQFTNWSQTSANPGNVAINLLHRSDGAAQTFQLSYVLSELCSKNNPDYLSYGITNLWNQPGFTNGAGTDSENYTASGGIPVDTSAPAVVWPIASLVEKGTGGIIDCVNGKDDSGTGEPCGQGVVSYITPSFLPNITGGGEALVQNLAGNFEPANATTIGAAINGASTPQRGPLGYPVERSLYVPFPRAQAAAPITGFSYGYFYECSHAGVALQTKGIQSLFSYLLTGAQATKVVRYWQFAPLNTTLKKSSLAAINALFAGTGKHSGSYIDPVSGVRKTYSCSP